MTDTAFFACVPEVGRITPDFLMNRICTNRVIAASTQNICRLSAWPGVSPSIAEYVQASQDALDDAARQKLLVLVPALIRCAGPGDPPEIESARRLLLAQRSLSLLVPLVLEATGCLEQAEAVRGSGGSFARIREPLFDAPEYAAANPLVTAVMDCAQSLVACADDGQPGRHAQLPFRTAELAVSVIHCNDAPARRLITRNPM